MTQGKSDAAKFKVYPALIVTTSLVILIGLATVVLGRFQIEIAPVMESSPSAPPVSQQTPGSSPLVLSSPTAQPSAVAVQPASPLLTALPGLLRVSNQTDHPVRLALLAKRASPDAQHGRYATPAHWDFAPSEGQRQGLILSLPEGKLQVNRGDILVAFAQDGSQIYWGPFVVGETSQPVWNKQTQEWQLIFNLKES